MQELKAAGTLENIYNITPDPGRSTFIVISQVGDYCIQVSITLTSSSMRDEPTPEQAKGKVM